jgi:hypothetical protein
MPVFLILSILNCSNTYFLKHKIKNNDKDKDSILDVSEDEDYLYTSSRKNSILMSILSGILEENDIKDIDNLDYGNENIVEKAIDRSCNLDVIKILINKLNIEYLFNIISNSTFVESLFENNIEILDHILKLITDTSKFNKNKSNEIILNLLIDFLIDKKLIRDEKIIAENITKDVSEEDNIFDEKDLSNFSELFGYLLKYVDNINQEIFFDNDKKQNIAMLVISLDRIDILEMLLFKGIDMKTKDFNSSSPLLMLLKKVDDNKYSDEYTCILKKITEKYSIYDFQEVLNDFYSDIMDKDTSTEYSSALEAINLIYLHK